MFNLGTELLSVQEVVTHFIKLLLKMGNYFLPMQYLWSNDLPDTLKPCVRLPFTRDDREMERNPARPVTRRQAPMTTVLYE